MNKTLSIIIAIAAIISTAVIAFNLGYNNHDKKCQPIIDDYQSQLDSLSTLISHQDTVILSNQYTMDSLRNTITVQNVQLSAMDKSNHDLNNLLKEYKNVLYAIVGEDGYLEYGVDPD